MSSADKTIVFINGVMGVIGSAIFSYFAELGEHVIYGTSRKGFYFDEYVDPIDGKLPLTNLVFSLADYRSEHYQIDIENLVDAVPDLPVIFIHSMGEYATELSRDGKIVIQNDHDGDGINDNVKCLSYEVPMAFCKKLAETKPRVTFVQIGSLSDKHKIDIHYSWVKSMDLLKNDLQELCEKHSTLDALVLNVSSLLTPKELIDRPFVSLKTNADMSYWLPPIEIAKYIDEYSQAPRQGFREEELYKKWPNISPDHFSIESYKMRRGKELYDSLAYEYKDVLNLADGDSISYKFGNPFHMDRLWGDLAILISRHHHNHPVVFYNPHSWFFIVRSRTEHEFFSMLNDMGVKMLVVARSNTSLNIATLEKAFANYQHEYRICASPDYGNNCYLNVYDDFIIEALLDQDTSDQIDGFYAKNDEIDSTNIKELKDIVSRSGKNQLTISRDHARAEKLREELSNGM